jgi:DNA invertase Pin-like site-specific DNA recombinase
MSSELGYELVGGMGTFQDGIYADRGLSGKSLEKRHEFQKMIQDAKTGKFQAILVTNVSRFARNAVDGIDEIRKLKKYNVYVHFLKENIKSCNHSDEFLIDFFMVFAQNELREMSKKIQDGIRKAQRKGVWTSQPPYGYDRVNGFLQINEKEAEIVKMIFTMYANQKMSINKISKYLNEKNILTKRGKKWQHTTLRHILQNPIYIGQQIGHQREMQDIFANIIRKTDEDEYIIHQNEDIRIINDEIFHAAQDEMKYRKDFFEHEKKYSTVNILSNLFYCGNCGSAMKRMQRSDKKGLFYYVCSGRHKDKTICQEYNYIKEIDILNFISNSIKKVDVVEYGLEIKDLYNWYIKKNLGNDLQNQLPEIEEKINKLKKRKSTFAIMLADGDIEKNEYRKLKSQTEIEIKELQAKKNRIINLKNEIDKVWMIYNDFQKSIKNFDIHKTNNAELRKIIKKITIQTKDGNKNIFIQWNSGIHDLDFGDIFEEILFNKHGDSMEYFSEDYV